jgi:hypothetical protein
MSHPDPTDPSDATILADDVTVAFDPAGRGFVSALAPTGPERTNRRALRTATNIIALDGKVNPNALGPPRTITSRPFDPMLGGPGGKHDTWWATIKASPPASREPPTHS